MDRAAVSFLAPISSDDSARFWLKTFRPDLAAGGRVLLRALADDRIVGTVQIVVAMPPNQQHRCEIAKMMVHPDARRRGIGRSLMAHALERAKAIGKTLDTRTGDRAEPLYASVGFEMAGASPDFAFDADGQASHSTTYMYRRL